MLSFVKLSLVICFASQSARKAVTVLIIFLQLKTIGSSRHCPISTRTLHLVNICPKTLEEKKEAASIKHCEALAPRQNCSNPLIFKYHCVTSYEENVFMEICAPEVDINSGYCATFDTSTGHIVANENKTCSNATQPCPRTYRSSESYRYTSCYGMTGSSESKDTQVHHQMGMEKSWKIVIPLAAISAVFFFLLLFTMSCILHKKRLMSKRKVGKKTGQSRSKTSLKKINSEEEIEMKTISRPGSRGNLEIEGQSYTESRGQLSVAGESDIGSTGELLSDEDRSIGTHASGNTSNEEEFDTDLHQITKFNQPFEEQWSNEEISSDLEVNRIGQQQNQSVLSLSTHQGQVLSYSAESIRSFEGELEEEEIITGFFWDDNFPDRGEYHKPDQFVEDQWQEEAMNTVLPHFATADQFFEEQWQEEEMNTVCANSARRNQSNKEQWRQEDIRTVLAEVHDLPRRDSNKTFSSSLRRRGTICIQTVSKFNHIGNVTQGRIWISDEKQVMEINHGGDILNHFNLDGTLGSASHTGMNDDSVLFIRDNKVIKFSNRKFTVLIPETSFGSILSICTCKTNTDIILGTCLMSNRRKRAKVVRYSEEGILISISEYIGKSKDQLYVSPLFLSENINGNICTSDIDTCLVRSVDKSGKLCFTYGGSQKENAFYPTGICTDKFGHVVVCNRNDSNPSVHLLDENGKLVSIILSAGDGLKNPWGLFIDDNNILYIGHKSNTIMLYRYLNL